MTETKRTAFYIQYWSPKEAAEAADPYYWGGAYDSLRKALDAANECEEKKPEAFGVEIYSREENWIPDEEDPRFGYWEGIDGTMKVYDRRGAVVWSESSGTVKGEQASMLGVPGKVHVQKRPWTPGQMGFESYAKYIEAMDRKYSLVELRGMCRERGISATGDKKTLVRRLF